MLYALRGVALLVAQERREVQQVAPLNILKVDFLAGLGEVAQRL